ncbi:MAG: glycosyltransferase family 2 protein [Haloarculaceae archaeon]
MGPLVSVVVPVYNEMTTLQETLRTILAQEYEEFEVIVVDDGSTDASAAVAHGIADRHECVRVIENETNFGQSFTRNRGTVAADGKYLVFHDADDLSTPDRLVKQVAFMENHPEVGVVGSAYYYDNLLRDERTVRVRPTDDETLRRNLARESMVNLGSAMYRWSALADTSLFRADHIEGYDLLVRIAADHEIANLRDPLYVYRVSENSMSRRDELAKKLTLVRRGVQSVQTLGVGHLHLCLAPGWLAYMHAPDRVKAAIRHLFSPTENRAFTAEDEHRLQRTLAVAAGEEPTTASGHSVDATTGDAESAARVHDRRPSPPD